VELPALELSYGQLLWAVNYGREPDQMLKDQARYLRTLGIPPAAEREASGSGKRIRYGFFDLIELGLAVTSLDFGFRPKEISAGLVANRGDMRQHYTEVWKEIPEAALQNDWVKSRGRMKPMFAEEDFVRLHDRRSERFGKIDLVGFEEATDKLEPFEPIERFDTGSPRRLIPLKRYMIQWVAWAREAPATKPGPAGKQR
jgi:hypothetical protein